MTYPLQTSPTPDRLRDAVCSRVASYANPEKCEPCLYIDSTLCLPCSGSRQWPENVSLGTSTTLHPRSAMARPLPVSFLTPSTVSSVSLPFLNSPFRHSRHSSPKSYERHWLVPVSCFDVGVHSSLPCRVPCRALETNYLRYAPTIPPSFFCTNLWFSRYQHDLIDEENRAWM